MFHIYLDSCLIGYAVGISHVCPYLWSFTYVPQALVFVITYAYIYVLIYPSLCLYTYACYFMCIRMRLLDYLIIINNWDYWFNSLHTSRLFVIICLQMHWFHLFSTPFLSQMIHLCVPFVQFSVKYGFYSWVAIRTSRKRHSYL